MTSYLRCVSNYPSKMYEFLKMSAYLAHDCGFAANRRILLMKVFADERRC
jgi:hypothetical protein